VAAEKRQHESAFKQLEARVCQAETKSAEAEERVAAMRVSSTQRRRQSAVVSSDDSDEETRGVLAIEAAPRGEDKEHAAARRTPPVSLRATQRRLSAVASSSGSDHGDPPVRVRDPPTFVSVLRRSPSCARACPHRAGVVRHSTQTLDASAAEARAADSQDAEYGQKLPATRRRLSAVASSSSSGSDHGDPPARASEAGRHARAEYEVERITDSRVRNGRTEWFVVWKGYDPALGTWESHEAMNTGGVCEPWRQYEAQRVRDRAGRLVVVFRLSIRPQVPRVSRFTRLLPEMLGSAGVWPCGLWDATSCRRAAPPLSVSHAGSCGATTQELGASAGPPSQRSPSSRLLSRRPRAGGWALQTLLAARNTQPGSRRLALGLTREVRVCTARALRQVWTCGGSHSHAGGGNALAFKQPT
jgi:hypothetical protein